MSPLVVVDSITSPRFQVVLTDVTWKWARSPNHETRRDYERFWTAGLDWLTQTSRSAAPLVLELQPREGPGNEVRGWVRPSQYAPVRDLNRGPALRALPRLT